MDEVVYRISHDLRASVRALRDLPDWLCEDLEDQKITLDGEAQTILDLIQSHSRRLDEMLNGLLEYSRVGRLQELAAEQPRDVFQEVLDALRPDPEVEFFVQFNPVDIRMGRADLRRVFRILMSNALSHGRGDPPRIEVTSCQSGEMWELMVADNGPGIRDKEKPEVIKPMVKLVARDEDEGGGMGLSILKKIADMYGGTLHIEDRRRVGGVIFRLRLPVVI
jgi:signal transduction histidine kinase